VVLENLDKARRALVTGFVRGGWISHTYTSIAAAVLALAIISYLPRWGWIIPSLVLVALLWTIFMVDLGVKMIRREAALTPLPLTEAGIPVDSEKVA
jgi:hypothetical protein